VLKNSNTILLTASIAGFERNWWPDWHECHFIVRQTTEDSFIIGVACDKKVGGSEARKPRSLKSGGGLKPSSLIEVYAYD